MEKKEGPVHPLAKVDKEDLASQYAKDDEVILALTRAGSNLSKPHSIEHHFYCPTKAKAAAVKIWGKAKGYRISEIHSDSIGGATLWSLDLIIDMLPKRKLVHIQTRTMLDLATKLGVEYDGWGCHVVE